MHRNERFGRGRGGRARDDDRNWGGVRRGEGSGHDREFDESFSREDYRGMTRGGYPGYGAGDAGWGGGYAGYGSEQHQGFRGGRGEQGGFQGEAQGAQSGWQGSQAHGFGGSHAQGFFGEGGWQGLGHDDRQRFDEDYWHWRNEQ